MKVVASYSKPEEAYLAASLLESSGIEAVVWDADTVNLNWLYSNAIGGVRLAVPDEDAERAREALNLSPVESGILACPYCGSDHVHMRELSLGSALLLIFCSLISPMKSRKVDCLDCGKTFGLKEAKQQAKTSGTVTPSP